MSFDLVIDKVPNHENEYLKIQFERLNLHPWNNNYMKFLEKDYAIEIIDSNLEFRFLNIAAFIKTEASVNKLLDKPFPEIIRRSDHDLDMAIGFAKKLIVGEVEYFDGGGHYPKHFIEIVPNKKVISYEMKYSISLFNKLSSDVAGFLCFSEIKSTELKML